MRASGLSIVCAGSLPAQGRGLRAVAATLLLLSLVALLWSIPAGAQERGITGFTPPVPAQYVIENAEATGELREGVVVLDITARVRIFRDEWTEVPLLRGDFAITSAGVEGGGEGNAFLKRTDTVYSLFAKGRSTVTVKLRVACRTEDNGGQKSATLPLVQALAASTSLTLPMENVRFKTSPHADASLEALDKGRSRITIFGSPAPALQLTWSPQPRLGDLPPLMFAAHDAAVEVSRGSLRVTSTFDFRVLQGTVKTLTLDLPAGANLLNVSGEGINRWDVKSGDVGAVLNIELAESIGDTYVLGITTETAIDKMPAALELPLAAAREVQREKGGISIRAQRGLKVEPGESAGVTQVDVAELFSEGKPMPVITSAKDAPQKVRQVQADLAFRFLARPVKVGLRVSEVSPKVTASVNTIASISRENVRYLHTIDYTIREAGMFRFGMRIPEGLKLLDVSGQNLNTWQVDKNTLWIDLRVKAEGEYTLVLETEQQVEPQKLLAILAPELLDVERETGYIAVASRAGARVELAGNPTGGAAQVDAGELPPQLRPKDRTVELGFRYLRHPFGISLTIGAVEPEVIATAASLLTIQERELQLETNIDLDVRKSGIFELRLAFPQGWRLSDDPRGKVIEDWRLDPATNVLTLNFGGRVSGRTQLSLRAEKSIDKPGAELEFPVLEVEGAKKETGFLAVASPLAMRMSAAAENYQGLNPIPPAELPDFLPAPRGGVAALAFKYLSSGWTLKVSLEEIKPLVTASITSVADISSTLVSTNVRINYDIKQAGTDTFYVQFPKNARSADISGENIKTRAPADNLPPEIAEAANSDTEMGVVWKVVLQERVRGGYMLHATFERALGKEDKNVGYEGLRALGVEREEGYVGLAASANVEVLPDASQTRGAAYRIDVRQIPGLPELRPQNPVIWAFQYNARPYLLDIKVTRHEDVPVVTAVADMAWFETVVGRDGQSTTDLFLSMRNNSQQYLHLLMPEGVRIWEAKVNGVVVPLAREAAEGGAARTLIPIAEASRGGKPFQITVRYEQALGGLGQWSTLPLEAPVISIPILRCLWDVYLPQEYGVVSLGGDMAESALDDNAGIVRFYRDNRRQVEANARMLEEEGALVQNRQNAVSRGLDTGAAATSGKAIHRYEKTMALNESQGKTPPARLRLGIMRDAFDNVCMVIVGLLAVAGAVLLWRRPRKLRLAYFGGALLLLYIITTLAANLYPSQVLAIFLVALLAFAATLVQGLIAFLRVKVEGTRELLGRFRRNSNHNPGKPSAQGDILGKALGGKPAAPVTPAPETSQEQAESGEDKE